MSHSLIKKIEWSAVVMAILAAASAVMYVTTANSKAADAHARIDRVVEHVHEHEVEDSDHWEKVLNILVEMRDRTARIEQWQKDHE